MSKHDLKGIDLGKVDKKNCKFDIQREYEKDQDKK